MNGTQKTPWYQTNLGAAIAGGVVLAVLGLLLVPLVEPLNVALRAVVVAAGLLVGIVIFSVLSKTWRARTWISLGRWFRGLGLLTNKKRARIRQEGFDARSTEVAEQRAHVRQPAWRLDARDALNERNLFWLNNHGAGATEVRVTADPAMFVLDGEVVWQAFSDAGPGGGSVGAWFKGYATDKGKAEGVNFHVTWYDGNGDPQEAEVHMPSSEIMAGLNEALLEEWAKGRLAGRTEAFEEARQEASGTETFKPLIRAQWVISEAPKQKYTWILRNMAKDSVAKHVSIDVMPAVFRAGSALDWEEVDGPGRVEFVGTPTQQGFDFGVTFAVSWTDVYERRQKVEVRWED